MWSDILGFLSAIFVGRVLYKLVDWVGNPENQGKIKSIFRFLKDWWPVLLGAYLVFGTGLVGFATGFISTLVGFAATLVGTVIPALVKAAIAMGPWGIAALALLGTAAIISTKKNKTDQKDDQSVKEVGAEETSNIIKDQQENRSPLQKAGDFLTGADQERKEQIQKLDTGTEKRYGFFGEIKPKEMNKGGTVPGSGNTDTVPAMLTPGEFVMSKGAVQKYGVNTMESMNAAAGGTNRPTMGRYSGGGKAAGLDKSHFGTEGYRMGQILPEQLYYNFDKYTSSYKTKDGEVVEDKDELIELSGAIGMPDLIEHQTQLVDSLRNVEGYEDINFMDVVQYPDNRGRLVGMPQETLYPIFNASDAWKASDAKRSEAIRIDMESGTQFLDPTKTAKSVGLKGGGLVSNSISNFNGGGLVQNFQGGGQVRKNAANIQPRKTAKTVTPSQKKKTTVAYQDQGGSMKSSNTRQPGNKEIPSFSATAMRSADKIKVLGISV